MFWSEVDGHCDNFLCENENEEDEEGNPIPITDEKINEYINDYFNFVEYKDRQEIFKQFKDYVNE